MTYRATAKAIVGLHRGFRLLPVIVLAAIAAGSAADGHAQPYQLLYEHTIGFDEDSQNVTFLGRGVLMLAEAGPAHPREVRVYSAQSGRALHTLACPPIDYTRDDLSSWCPSSIAATGRFFVLRSEEVVRVFARSGELLADIVPPADLPPSLHGFAGGFAVRGRRIVRGGPAHEGGRRVPGFVVYVYDAPTGALLDRHRVDVADGYSVDALAFAGRTLVARLRPPWRDPSPDVLVAIDSRTGARLWAREARSPDGRHFGPGLVGLGSDVMVGAVRLQARTGESKTTYALPGPGGYSEVAASGRLVAIAQGGAVHVFSAGGTFLQTVVPPPSSCDDAFGETLGVAAGRLLVTTDSYCGSGHAFVFGLKSLE